jgi:hypothetical protein
MMGFTDERPAVRVHLLLDNVAEYLRADFDRGERRYFSPGGKGLDHWDLFPRG